MSTDYGCVNAKCPFYLNEEDRKIKCEGIQNGCVTTWEFSHRAEKKAKKTKHCDNNYQQCALYQLLDGQYE